jgi:S-adenosylmethionine:tRNA ribosyltransferase-isomerase
MRVSDFDYDLPDELVARYPSEERSNSRLLVFNRSSNEIEHRRFHNIVDYLKRDDLLLVNDTRVFKARLFGNRSNTGGKVEILCLSRVDGNIWRVLSKPARRLLRGARIDFGRDGSAVIVEELDAGERVAEFSSDPTLICERAGRLPLPPYISRDAEDSDLDRYQTVYSEPVGSVAAPTAGLHFTRDLLSEIEARGVKISRITLHIGWGTFKPVATEKVEDHVVESEWYSVDSKAASAIREARSRNQTVFVIGTTTTRAIESWWGATKGSMEPYSGVTDLFINPGYRFNLVDKLVTNFHLPKSSLLMLVSAFAGRIEVLRCYKEAIDLRYRFYSYGDAMLLI